MGQHQAKWPAASMPGHVARARALRFFCAHRFPCRSSADDRLVSTRAIARIIATGSRVRREPPGVTTQSRRTSSTVNDVIDVIIVGGGPAGLYAGLRLAESGHTVALYEEHAD